MTEPSNHTAVIDEFGDTWVRVDELPGRNGGTWYPLTDGPGWDESARNGIGMPRGWDQVDSDYWPFVEADAERTARAVDRIRQEASR